MSFWTGSRRKGLGPRLRDDGLAEACGDPQDMMREYHGPGDAAGFLVAFRGQPRAAPPRYRTPPP